MGKIQTKPYKLLDDFKTLKKQYKKGRTIRATDKGAAYLRTIKKIK
jgi:hypothetical protein